MPASTAEEMRATVLGLVRAQHARRVGAPRNCPPPVPPAPPCRCCWHADFVGGARTKGRVREDYTCLTLTRTLSLTLTLTLPLPLPLPLTLTRSQRRRAGRALPHSATVCG